jgi:hypothetical protein
MTFDNASKNDLTMITSASLLLIVPFSEVQHTVEMVLVMHKNDRYSIAATVQVVHFLSIRWFLFDYGN